MPKANHQIILVQSHPSRTEKVTEQRPKFQKNLFYYKEKGPGQWVIFQSDTRTRSLQVHYLTALNRQMCHQQDSLWVTSGQWRVCPKRQLSSLVSCQVFRSRVEKPLLEKKNWRQPVPRWDLRRSASSAGCYWMSNETLTEKQQNFQSFMNSIYLTQFPSLLKKWNRRFKKV